MRTRADLPSGSVASSVSRNTMGGRVDSACNTTCSTTFGCPAVGLKSWLFYLSVRAYPTNTHTFIYTHITTHAYISGATLLGAQKPRPTLTETLYAEISSIEFHMI